jgi:hypothetical protein
MSRNRHVPANLLRPRLLVRRERAVSEHHKRYDEDVTQVDRRPVARGSASGSGDDHVKTRRAAHECRPWHFWQFNPICRSR